MRIIRALREMGIRSVAVYSDADRSALHVRMADEAEHIGPSPSHESYLRIDRILEAARGHGVYVKQLSNRGRRLVVIAAEREIPWAVS